MLEWALSRVHARVLLQLAVAIAALVMCASAASAQVGTTTDLIIGRVLGPDTLPLKRAHVSVTSVESGITRTTSTNEEGRYSVVFPDGGGKYVVTAQYLGMFPTRTMVQRQADEDRLVADFQLAESPVVLQAIRVLATQLGDTALASAGANGKVISRELLDRLGYLNDDATAIAMITPGVSFTPGSDTSLSAISIGGQAPSQTAHSIDGMASGASVPREGVKNTVVVTSEYDVSRGRFTGGFIEQQTISGTNTFRASVNSSVPLAPIGSSGSSGALVTRQSGFDMGGNASGPIRKDHVFFAGAFHASHSTSPNSSVYTLDPAALGRLGVAPDSLNRFLDIASTLGIGASPGIDLAPGRGFDFQNGFARIDVTPDEHNTFSVWATGFGYKGRGFYSNPLSMPMATPEFMTRSGSIFAALTSHAGSWVNDARASVSRSVSGTNPVNPATGGSVVVPSTQASGNGTPGIATITFGGYSAAEQLTHASSWEAKDELSRLSDDGAHRVKLGVDVLGTRATGGVPGNVYGHYSFNSLADLEAGHPASFARSLAPSNRRSGVLDEGAYLGDAWRAGPVLQLVYGARVDRSDFSDAPAFNPAVATAFGVRTDRFPHETVISPRIGFTLLPGAGQGKQAFMTVRGGIGEFRSGGSALTQQFAAARNATGLAGSVSELSCVGASVPSVDWSDFLSASSTLPTACADGGVSTGSPAPPTVALIDPSLRAPRSLRASLSVDKTLRKIWSVSIEGSLTNETANTGAYDLNLVASPRFTLGSEGGRPVYVNPGAIVPSTGAIALADSRVNPAFGVVGLFTSTLRDWDRSVSLSLGRSGKKISVNLSYTRDWSQIEQLGQTPTIGSFGWASSTRGDPRMVERTRSPWAPPHAFRINGTYTPVAWLQISPSLYVSSGWAFDPDVSGDVNGDGASNDLAFIFDPAHTSDTTVANGMRRLLSTAPKRVRDCLESQLGRIAAPASCSMPVSLYGGLALQVTPPWHGRRVTLSVQMNNVFSGADLLLHGPDHLHGWGAFNQPDERLLYVRGFDPATQQFKYAVNERFGVSRPNQTYMLQPLQLTLRANVNLGSVGSPMGKPGAKPGASGGMSADMMRARLARTIPNPFRRTIELEDSLALALDSAQLAKLKLHGDAFQLHADSIVMKLATIMSAPLTGPGAADVAARVRTETDAGQTLEKGAIADLRTILTDAQFAKLPVSVTKPPVTTPPPVPAKPAPAKAAPHAPASH
jgi:hypothetical protein